MLDLGKDIYQFSKDIFYLNRSLTGEGVRENLNLILKKVENLKVKSFNLGIRYLIGKFQMNGK